MIPMLLVGCGKEENKLNIKEDFIEIQSMTYTTYYTEEDENYYKQKNSSLYSRFYIDAEINYEVTEEEYNSAVNKLEDYEYKNYIKGQPYFVSSNSYELGYRVATSINQARDNIPNISNNKLNIGTTYFCKIFNNDYTQYFSCHIKSFKVIYVQMKIISDSVIEIIDDDEHYVVQTVYYKANFLN
jgi:hypothetical protein